MKKEIKAHDIKKVMELTDALLNSKNRDTRRAATSALYALGYPVRTVAEVMDLNREAIRLSEIDGSLKKW